MFDGPSQPRVKGVAFRTVDACFLELRGEQARARARNAMSPEVASAFSSGLVLAASWYPIAWYRDLLRSLRASTAEGPELIRQIGHLSMRHDMKSVYKQIFARFVSPQTMLSISNRLFSTYYDTGAIEVLDAGKGHVLLRMSGCAGWDGNMYTEIEGSSVSLLEISGARQVKTKVVSGGRDGTTEMTLEASWE